MNGILVDRRGGTRAIFLFALALGALFAVHAQAVVVNVVDANGTPIAGGFRWLLEEDNTNVSVPGIPVRVSISTDIHNSHAPVVAEGHEIGVSSVNITTDVNGSPLDAGKRYFISVLPDSGYANGGTVIPANTAIPVDVTVNQLPMPTAQISLLAFVDHNPINNVFDEHDQGLGGALILLSDIGGQVTQDAYGNPLGTTYVRTCDEFGQNPGTGSYGCLDVDGNPTVVDMGTGSILTLTQDQFDAGGAANPYNLNVGEALIKNLVPGKYGIQVVPPGFDDDGIAMTWSQTSTIEGTPTVDAWVKAREPKLFVEGFGTGFKHVFYGFVKVSPATSTFKGQTYNTLEWNQTPPAATGTITGTLRMNHFSKPPALQGYFPGVIVPGGWVGINDPLVQPGALLGEAGKYAAPCNEDGSFIIENVPPGTYQLVTWDSNLDTLFNFHTVTVPPGASGTGGTVDLGNLLTFRWFGTLESNVFYDADEDGFRDPGEPGIPEQNVNLRFRDGTIYQAFPTDGEGYVPFDEVFPFFKWLVVEVDFARFKATGMTAAIDDGGPIPGPGWPANGNKNPQPQDLADPFNEHGTLDYRTETGPVLTQAMHLFLGQTNLIDWGKSSYGAGENGGISGIVFYAVTRAENDPRYAVGEGWEPGIPRVQVNLYEDMVVNATGQPGSDGIIDDLDADGDVTLADVDNYPFNWAPMYEFLADGVTPNPDYAPTTPGPEDIDYLYPGQVANAFDFGDAVQIATTDSWDDNKPSGCIQTLPDLPGLGPINECADSFGTWNQVRPGIFDGGYAFDSYFPGGMTLGGPETDGLPTGFYIVEAVPPPGYDLVKEEDKNVDFGDTYIPSPLLLPPVCVGDMRTVPDFLSFDGSTPAPYAGDDRPLCDRKQVTLSEGQNAAADFFLFTQVPKAARAVGFVNNDLGAEFNQASPIYGEKLAASWLPVSFRDWQGKELVRVYTDEFGGYNAMLPSTYTVNVPSPSGVSPSMITLVLNDPYFADGITPDPYYDPDYAVTPWTFNYMPGATSYLDTPIVPTTAFTASDIRLDTGPANGTPVIYSVTTDSQAGPLVCTTANPLPATITLTSPETLEVRNPLYPRLSTEPTVTRDVGFGVAQGTGGTVTLDGVALPVVSWTNSTIVATVPGGSATGRIMVTRDNGLTAEVGVTLNILDCTGLTVRTVAAGQSIQDAIDAAAAGDIILVGTGNFAENVVMDKPLRLQGRGYGSVINANPIPLDRIDAWHARMDAMGAREFVAFLLKDPFSAAETPAIMVVGQTAFFGGNLQNPETGTTNYLNLGNPFDVPSAIDGFTLAGSKAGGGIFVVSGTDGLVISNNNISNNQGNFGGGIGIGTPDSGFPVDADGNSMNANVVIRHNKIHRNGGIQGGGGIALNEGSDNYLVEGNLIIGNFGRFNGGGIQHRGISFGDNVIRQNRILFNEVFFGVVLAVAGDGAGIYIGGDVAGGTGSGSVTIDGNLIQGNMSGAGNGGGIRAFAVNAQDVLDSPADDTTWYRLNIFNNMIVNNIAGYAGAGISLQDVARANIVNNTIARNDSTATSSLAFQPGQEDSAPQPAGIVSNLHSSILQGLFGLPEPTYSDPLLVNNIIYQNRSYFNDASLNGGAGGLALNPAGQFWDVHVVGSVASSDPHLDPEYCILSSLTDPATGFGYSSTNRGGPAGFLGAYYNFIESTTVVDEGGNNISLRFTPLAIAGSDYHVGTGQAWNGGSNVPVFDVNFPELLADIDGDTRPFGGAVADIGADEIPVAVPPALAPGIKGNPSPPLDLGPINNVQGSMLPGASGGPAGYAAKPAANMMARAKEKLVSLLENIIPGTGDAFVPASIGGGSGTQPSQALDAPDGSKREMGPAGRDQLMTGVLQPVESEDGNLVRSSANQMPGTGNPVGVRPNLAQSGETPSGSVSLRLAAEEKAGRSQANGAGVRQQDGSMGIMFRYALVFVLLLAGLAFFVIILPKARKSGNMNKRGDI